MPPALQAACGDGPRRAWQPGVRAPAQPQSRGQTTVPAEGPESRKDLKGSVSPSTRSSQQPPAARLPHGPRVSQRDGGTAPAPSPDRARGPRGTLGRRGRPVCLHRARALGAHRTSSTGPGNAGSSSATGSAHGGVSRACCGATRESKTLGYKGPTRSRMLHATPSLAGAHAWTPRPSPSLQPQSPCPRRRALRKPHSGPSAVSAGPEGLRDVCGVTVET